MSKKKKQKIKRNAAYIKKNAIDINKTQMMVGKQWVKRWGMYRWAGEASTQVKKVSSNNGYEAEGKAFWYIAFA